VAKLVRDEWLSLWGFGGYVGEGWVAKLVRDGWLSW
jgi:hypothetical protein